MEMMYCPACMRKMTRRSDGGFLCETCGGDPPVPAVELPPSWDPDRMAQELITFEMPILVAVSVHGAVMTAIKLGQFPESVKAVLYEFLAVCELALEDAGLEQPPEGWRSWATITYEPP